MLLKESPRTHAVQWEEEKGSITEYDERKAVKVQMPVSGGAFPFLTV